METTTTLPNDVTLYLIEPVGSYPEVIPPVPTTVPDILPYTGVSDWVWVVAMILLLVGIALLAWEERANRTD